MRTHSFLRAFLAVIMISAPGTTGTLHAAERIAGPVAAELVRVIDGDTVLVSAMPWPDHRVTTYVRLRGIDAPELKSHCPATRHSALEAQAVLSELLAASPLVSLTDISGDKYYGRVVAAIRLADGSDPTTTLLAEGLAEPYRGGHKKTPRCS